MNKKLFCVFLSMLMIFILTSCGTPKLVDKQEKANYADMKNGKFNAKYTSLDSIKLYNTYDDEGYPNKKAFKAYDNENNRFNIIFSGVNKDKELKTTFGTKLGGTLHKEIKINKAEVVAERLNSKKYDPTLLVDISDIESIDENKLQALLESNKSYEELNADKDSPITAYMMSVKDGDLKYDPKYSDRVATLTKEFDESINQMNAKIKEDSQKQEQEKAKKEQENIASYDTGITYEQLARTPDDYKGRKAKFSGKVLQVIEGNGETNLRIAVDGNYDTILLVDYKNDIISTRILENDYVTVRGTSNGIYAYQSTIGKQVSVPSMLVDKIELSK